ncbi:mannose-1-phosphate guanylyltransferase [Thermovenabulum sp.]|uniref:mannose-1-phosphate guanylyltransferase n=2 Tax=Thermovenabulum sp. TaxID=3100335 RepID=UPI003C7EB46E
MKRYGVIMAGGGGTRFWPLSRKSKPKQFLNITGEDTMINDTIKRIMDLVPPEQIIIVTNKAQELTLKKVLMKEIPEENILVEPFGRNTAACIAYASMIIEKRDKDSCIGVFPSDHYIKNVYEFQKVLDAAFCIAENTDKLITMGINPTFPSTGYGYIKFDKESPIKINEIKTAYEVKEFVEKPDVQKAKQYIESGDYLWNSGMFVWKTRVILNNFERFLPRIYYKLKSIIDVLYSNKGYEELEKVYKELPDISIDYGIMERALDVAVIPCDFGWSDVGSWDSLGSVIPPDENGNIIRGEHVEIETKNSIIFSNGRMVAAVGLEDMIVVETQDAILVCPKRKAQDVKKVVEQLKKIGREDLL